MAAKPNHPIAGADPVRYAQESAWREDLCRLVNGVQVKAVAGLALACRLSVDWCGAWQRAQIGVQRSVGVRPVCFATRANILGPISSPSWNGNR